jgi:competence protein ComEA
VLGTARVALSDPLWRPVWIKVASFATGMLGLAAIGMYSTLHQPGVGVDPQQLAPEQLAESNVWLAGAVLSAGPSLPPEAARPHPAVHPREAEPAQTKAAPADDAPASRAEPEHDPPTEESETKPLPGVTADGKVILNTASVEELTRLPGIGKKRAEKIVELRTRLERFKDPTQLLRVRGIGVKSLRKMLPHLVVDPPE